MKAFAAAEWERALRTISTAELLVERDPDSVASRAYYAAFHAVTALFALRGQTFTKHSALRSALHRELIQAGQWEAGLGQAFDLLMDLRESADYGGVARVTPDSARRAVDKGGDILQAVRQARPELDQQVEPE